MFLSNRPFVALALVIFTLSAPLNAANAQTAVSVDVTPDQLRIMAANSIVNGNPTQGYEMAQALLARDPNDVEALIIRARAARDGGRHGGCPAPRAGQEGAGEAGESEERSLEDRGRCAFGEGEARAIVRESEPFFLGRSEARAAETREGKR